MIKTFIMFKRSFLFGANFRKIISVCYLDHVSNAWIETLTYFLLKICSKLKLHYKNNLF